MSTTTSTVTANSGNELPSYSPSTLPPHSSLPQLSFSLERKGRKWAYLYLNSRLSAAPVYFHTDTISGRVELDLEKAEVFREVVVAVR